MGLGPTFEGTEGSLAQKFSGERLHDGDDLFRVDLARHRAAYRFAAERLAPGGLTRGRLLDFGSGSGYGVAELAARGFRAYGLDRVEPDTVCRETAAGFVRADLFAPPFASGSFDALVSFQVIEHLEEPGAYLDRIAELIAGGGCAILTTPNRLTSDGANPYHVHEYTAGELAELLEPRFAEVEMLGVGASEAARRFYDGRLRIIRTILRLDPLGLRHRLPAGLARTLFARLAVVVRRLLRRRGAVAPLDWRDFPVAAARDDDLDLLAVVSTPS